MRLYDMKLMSIDDKDLAMKDILENLEIFKTIDNTIKNSYVTIEVRFYGYIAIFY